MARAKHTDPAEAVGSFASGEFSGAAYERYTTTVSCVMTRFYLRSPLWLLPFYLAFRHVKKQAADIPGLVRMTFLVENWRTCYTVSIWENESAIVDFSTRVTNHIHVANWSFGKTFRHDKHRPEIWSVQWRLFAVSHNLNWDGVDLRAIIASQLARDPQEIAPGMFS